MLLVAVSLDPHNVQEADFEVPLWEWGLPDDGALEVEDLLMRPRDLGAARCSTFGSIPPHPYAIWRARPAP